MVIDKRVGLSFDLASTASSTVAVLDPRPCLGHHQANETDTEGGYMPYISVVDDDGDDDGDDDDGSSERKSAAAVVMGACALALSTVVLMTLVWLVLAVQDLKMQVGAVPTEDLNNKL